MIKYWDLIDPFYYIREKNFSYNRNLKGERFMDNNTNKEFIERLNEEIESLIIILQAKDPAEEDYKTINDNLKTLLEVKEVYQKERLRETEIEAKQSEAEMKKKLIEEEDRSECCY